MTVATTKWWEIVRFELSTQFRRKSTWLFFALYLVPLIGVTDDRLRNAAVRPLLYNAPLSVAQFGAVFTLVAMLWLAAVVADAATRDVSTGMEPLVRVTPISAAHYVGGRFFGAFLVAAILLAIIPILQLVVGIVQPATATGPLGPIRPMAYVQSFFLLILPSAFVATAILFAFATLLRHSLGSYVGAVGVVAGMQVSSLVVGSTLGKWQLASMLDPTAITALSVMTQTWSPTELNERYAATMGTVLLNRLLWVSLASAAVLFLMRRYRVAGSPAAARWWQRGLLASARPAGSGTPGAVADVVSSVRAASVEVPRPARHFGTAAGARQVIAIARDSLREIGVWGWLLVPLLVLRTNIDRSMLTVMAAGTRILPATDRIFTPLDDVPPPIVLLIIMFPVLLAGELIWRERDARMQGLVDSAPVSDGIRFLGKLLGMWIVILTIHLMLMVAGILAQASLGWYDFQLPVYLKVLFGAELVGPLLFALFALSIHVIANQKHVGHLLVLALIIAPMTIAETFGFEHPMLLLGKAPRWRYSAMSGFGPYLAQIVAFHLYWGAWTLLLAMVARLFWVRGVERGVRERLRLVRARFSGQRARAVAGALALVLVFGGFIFYNTNILNTYMDSDTRVTRLVEYEKTYGVYRRVPLPDLARTELNVEIHPDRAEAEVRGVHHVVNRSRQPIDTIHLAIAPGVTTGEITFDRPARAVTLDDELGHRIYGLSEPLQPGDSLSMTWQVHYAPRGFRAEGASASVVPNGTFIEMVDWIPLLGYQANREITSAAERQRRGLPPRADVRSLDDVEARKDATGRDLVMLDVIVGTAMGQTAVAPGELVRSWTQDGRAYFHYTTNSPIGQGYALFSANYAMKKARAGDVSVEVFHNPRYEQNVDRILRGMQVSLGQFNARFGPYPHNTLRFVEYPSAGGSLHATFGTIWFQEMFGLFDPDHEPRKIDLPFAVVGHEVAHQFQPWAARVEGQILLSESFAWYAALNVVEQEYGVEHLKRLMDFFRESYLRLRPRADVPLIRASDSYQGYRKGPFAMYALQEYVGREKVDLAWRRLIEQSRTPEPPFVTAPDLVRELRRVTPDSLQDLIGDLLERNTFWELEARQASAQQRPGGEWQVTLDVSARKVTVDTAGTETERPMNDLVEVGAWGTADSTGEGQLYLAKHRVRSGRQTITFTVPRQPTGAGIDPRHLLIDVEVGNNSRDVTVKARE